MSTNLIVDKLRIERPESGLLRYFLGEILLNDKLGALLSIEAAPEKICKHCGRKIKKTFNQGYCFPCFRKLAACDLCVLKPELCHYDKGTCREPRWGDTHCRIDHLVYLANTTSLKIGLTRKGKEITRWGDQGALAALPLAFVPERKIGGFFEKSLRSQVSDKTDWRMLLRGEFKELDLVSERERVFKMVPGELRQYLVDPNEWLQVQRFEYPVQSYLSKAKVHNFDKQPLLKGVLRGIHGQYLIFDDFAVNMRKYGGYQFRVEV